MDREQLEEAHHIAALVIGFIRHDLTSAQSNELDEWIGKSDENSGLFKRLTDESNIEESRRWFDRIDEETALYNLRLRIERRGRMKRLAYRLSASAVVLIVVTLGLFWFLQSRRREAGANPIVAEVHNYAPARDSVVVLITSGGAEIPLGKRQQFIPIGDHLSVREEDNGLVYLPGDVSAVNTVRVPAKKQYRVTLSDGTKVWLNAQSALVYPTSFNDSTRQVELTGEGFFDIAKNKNKAFIVHCGQTSLRVLGTEFNVNAYPGDTSEQITILSGTVEVRRGDVQRRLIAEEQALVFSQGKVVLRTIPDAGDIREWTKGLFHFNHSTIGEVLQQLTRWYNIKASSEGQIDKLFSGTIPRTASLTEVLRMLELSGRVHFVLTSQQITVRP